jgi:hypothetical protein
MGAGAGANRAAYLHVGDVVWRLWDTLIAYDPERVVSLWEDDDGSLLGFALFYPMYAGFSLQVHPKHRGGEAEVGMLTWAEERANVLAREEGHHGAIDAWDVFEGDADRIALLERRGFARRPEVYAPRCTTWPRVPWTGRCPPRSRPRGSWSAGWPAKTKRPSGSPIARR